MTFLTASKEVWGILSLWLSLVQMLYVFNFFRYIQIGKRRSNVRCIALCLTNFVLLQILFQHMDGEMLCPVSLPLWQLLLIIALLTVLAFAEQWRIAKWNRTHISATSIKEALDILRKAWDGLCSGQANGLIKAGPEPIYELPGGRVYSFRQEEISLEVGTVQAIFATDVTEEYALTRELAKKQRQVGIINARLKALLGTIEYVTMSRELLQLKVALHDNLGRSLLAAKRYVLNPEGVDPKDLFAIWKQNLSHLIGEGPEEWQVPYYIAKKEAATLGIDLQIVGTLPEEETILSVIDQAISTHVINVLRHANGHVAMVQIWEEEKEYNITFTNDGDAPTEPIRETGGLGNLKQQVEALGGSMELSASPRFKMILTIPKGEGKTWHGKQ